MNFSIKHYYKPTPKRLRKIGDSLLGIALFAAPYEIVRDNHFLGISFLFIGIFGKFLTNFFSEEQDGK